VRRYRTNSQFICAKSVQTILTPRQRNMLLKRAEAHALKYWGSERYTTLQLFRFLLLTVNRAGQGCQPSYKAIRKRTGLCFQSISNGLKRLERARLLFKWRRLERQRVVRDPGGYVMWTLFADTEE